VFVVDETTPPILPAVEHDDSEIKEKKRECHQVDNSLFPGAETVENQVHSYLVVLCEKVGAAQHPHGAEKKRHQLARPKGGRLEKISQRYVENGNSHKNGDKPPGTFCRHSAQNVHELNGFSKSSHIISAALECSFVFIYGRGFLRESKAGTRFGPQESRVVLRIQIESTKAEITQKDHLGWTLPKPERNHPRL
jgi:hypothetical protein